MEITKKEAKRMVINLEITKDNIDSIISKYFRAGEDLKERIHSDFIISVFQRLNKLSKEIEEIIKKISPLKWKKRKK